jgi:putative zinc-binding metallo-peptidase
MFVAMPSAEPAPISSRFHESNLWATPIRDLGLTIAGTPLQPIIEEFREELRQAGITRVRPRFYLSTEWGVPFETVAIAIPFYLARPELTALHAERVGHVEGFDRADILRYLRHEMGHVVNYAYRLYDEEEWVKQFGSITQPYGEEYRPEPFSRRYVRHLPGWYAQKHPDEDWAETFAVWMTPGLDWRAEYGGWPVAAAKLQYCDRIMQALRDRDPVVTSAELDEDVAEIEYSLGHYYRDNAGVLGEVPPGLDGALRAIFEDLGGGEGMSLDEPLAPAAPLIRRLEPELLANVFRWTGHFPERTRVLVRYLADRAEQLRQGYAVTRESAAIVALTTFVTGLAMNHVQRGSYLP